MPYIENIVYIIFGALGLIMGFLSLLLGQEHNYGKVWMWMSILAILLADLLVVVSAVRLLLTLLS